MKFPVRKVIFQTAVSAFLGVLTLGVGFARVYFFSRKLSVEEFGILSLLLTFSAFLMYVFTMGSFQYLFKNVSLGAQERRNSFWSSLAATVAISLMLTTLSFLLLDFISDELNLTEYKWPFMLMITGTSLTAVMTILAYYHYGQGRNNFQNLLQFLRASLWVVAAIGVSVFLKLDLNVILLIFNISLILIIAIAFPWKELNSLLPVSFPRSEISSLMRYSFPLLPYFAGAWGIPLIIRSELNIYEGAKQVALFSVAYTLMEIMFLFISNIVSTLSPYFFSSSDDNRPIVFYNVMLKYAALSTIVAVPFVFTARYEIIALVASEKYLVAGDYIPLLLGFPLVRILVLVFEQYYLKTSQTVHLGLLYLITILICGILCVWLIPAYSIFGAIWASLISYSLILLFLYYKQHSMLDFKYLRLPGLILFTVMLGAALFLLHFWDLHVMLRIFGLGICAIVGLFLLPILDDREKGAIAGILRLITKRFSNNSTGV